MIEEPPSQAERLIQVKLRYLAVGLVTLALVACGEGGDPDLATPTTPAGVDPGLAPGTTVTPESAVDVAKVPPNIVEEMAILDLARRLDVPEDSIEIEATETGVWTDGSLGCPESGSLYTQGLVPGTRVILSHGGQSYAYHQGGADDPFPCDEPVEDAFKGVEGDTLIPPPGYDY